MNRRFFPALMVLAFCCLSLSPCRAIDVKDIPQHLRIVKSYLIRPISFEMDGSEIRRPAVYEYDPKSQIAVWQAFIEPPPVVRTPANMLTSDAKIFRNTGSTKTDFPFVVRGEKDGPDKGKYFVFRNVKYNWFFEQVSKGDEPEGSNVKGVSSANPWTPFLNLKNANSQFVLDMAVDKVTKTDVWDKKLYPNRHMVSYDSGISGSMRYKESTVLQQVGMIMTYERAEVAGLSPSGAGYPPAGQAEATADPAGDIPDTVALNSAPADSVFKKGVSLNDIPEALAGKWNLTASIDGKSYSTFTAYALVYVEDHNYPKINPALLDPTGNVYKASVGGWLGDGMSIDYTDSNPSAEVSSQQLSSNFSYFMGSEDIYHIDNPFYDGSSDKDPVLFFYYLPSNDEYGPYVGGADVNRELRWYTKEHPYWKDRTPEERKAFLGQRYAGSWASEWLKPWEKGVVYYILNNDHGGNGNEYAKALNEAWKTGSMAKCPNFTDLIAELDAKGSAKAKNAKAALEALKTLIEASKGPERAFNRFANISYAEERGRCVVGPVSLEKENAAVHTESNKMITDPSSGRNAEVESGNWNVGAKRVIAPLHCAMNSIEWCNKKTPLKVEGKSPKESKDLYNEWCKHPPDCLIEATISNCCGNSAPVGSLMEVHDDAAFSKPMCDCEINDLNTGSNYKVSVPCGESVSADSKIVREDKQTKEVKDFPPFACSEEFDMGKYNWYLQDKDGNKKPLSTLPEEIKDPLKDKLIVEDSRLNIKINPYDNIDKCTPFKGITKTEFTIEALDDNKQPTGKFETLESSDNGKVVTNEKLVKDGTGLSNYDLYQFDPSVNINHIFRAPGWYQAKAKVFDRAVDGSAGQSRDLTFNIRVVEAGFKSQGLDSQQERK